MGSFDPIWEQIHQEQEWGQYPSEEIIRFVARNYYQGDRAAIRLLDLGCGTGAVSWYLRRERFAVYGLDGSPTAIDKAEQRLRKEGLKAVLTVGDAAEIPYASCFFNGIVDSAMIYANTVANIRTILKECHRVLKPLGKLFSSGLFKVGMTGYGTGAMLDEHTFRELTEGSLAHRGTAHFFDERQIYDLWGEAGFNQLTIDSVARTDMGGTRTVSFFIVEAQK